MINAHQSGQFLTQYNWVTTLGPSVRQSTLQLPEGLVVCSHLGTGLRMCKDRSSYQRVIFRQCTQENSRDPEKLWTVEPWPLFLKTQRIKDTPVKRKKWKTSFSDWRDGKTESLAGEGGWGWLIIPHPTRNGLAPFYCWTLVCPAQSIRLNLDLWLQSSQVPLTLFLLLDSPFLLYLG